MMTHRRSFDLIVSIAVSIHRSDPSEPNATSSSFMTFERSSGVCSSTIAHNSESSDDCGGYNERTEAMASDSEGYQGARTLQHQHRNQWCRRRDATSRTRERGDLLRGHITSV